MQTPTHAEFPAILDSLRPLAGWLEVRMSTLAVNDEWRFALELAVCEIATNIIRHALHEDASRSFKVQFDISDRVVSIVFTDTGDRFPLEQLEVARRDQFSDLSPLLESGRGLMIVLHSVEVFCVRREKEQNITTIEKQIFTGQGREINTAKDVSS